MKKIGFIDYYLDEWHANNYPDFFEENADGEFKVCYAYGKIDSPIGGMSNKEWAEKYKVELLPSIEEVVEKSDCIIVLSPDNPEMHEELSEIPLKSGKLTYIDKTFAPDKEAARRIFELADKYGTKCFSTSALRYAEEIQDIDISKVSKLYCEGSGNFEHYSIHQVEPIVKLMQCKGKRVMYLDNSIHPEAIIEFEDGRMAHMFNRICADYPFKVAVCDETNRMKCYEIHSKYFNAFTKALIEFFKTGVVPVSHNETVNVIAICEALRKSKENPYTWLNI